MKEFLLFIVMIALVGNMPLPCTHAFGIDDVSVHEDDMIHAPAMMHHQNGDHHQSMGHHSSMSKDLKHQNEMQHSDHGCAMGCEGGPGCDGCMVPVGVTANLPIMMASFSSTIVQWKTDNPYKDLYMVFDPPPPRA